MSKLISVVGGPGAEWEAAVPADLSNEYETLIFELDKKGRPLWYGETDDYKRRLRADIVLKAYGHDPAEKFDPQPVAAISTINGSETPVIVYGFHGVKNEVTYYKIKGSNTGVPLSQLQWLKPAEQTGLEPEDGDASDPESLNGGIEELQIVVDEFITTLEGMKAELREFKVQKANLETENKKLSHRHRQLEALLVANNIEVPDDDERPELAPVEKESTHEDVRPIETPTPLEETTPQGRPSAKSSLLDRLRYHLGGGSAYVALSRRIEEKNGRRFVVTEGELPPDVEYIPDERDRFVTGVVAGAFAVGATALITWALTRHGGHSHEFTEIINQNKHLNTEVHNLNTKVHDLHQTVNHDSAVIAQNNHILKHNRAELKHVHEQLHTIYKMEKTEEVSSPPGSGSGEARLSYSGDTVWHETARRLREKLGHSATAAKIHKATAYVLHLNGWRWNGGDFGVDAHKLPIDTRIKMPSNIVEIANR